MIRLSVLLVICVAIVVVWDQCVAEEKSSKKGLEMVTMAPFDGEEIQNEKGLRSRRSLFTWWRLLVCKWGFWDWLRRSYPLWGYGCYCGSGGHSTPVDSIDSCCMDHDACWAKAKRHYVYVSKWHWPTFSIRHNQEEVCNGKWHSYGLSYNCDCKAGQGDCRSALCRCDTEFADCISAEWANYNGKKKCNSK